MNKKQTAIIGVFVLFLLDLVMFVVPLGSVLLVLVATTKPKWFYDWVQEIYQSS